MIDVIVRCITPKGDLLSSRLETFHDQRDLRRCLGNEVAIKLLKEGYAEEVNEILGERYSYKLIGEYN